MPPDKPRARANDCKDNEACGSLMVQEIVRKWPVKEKVLSGESLGILF